MNTTVLFLVAMVLIFGVPYAAGLDDIAIWGVGGAAVFLAVGWLLQTKALTMIICANVLLDQQIITPSTFTALLLMAVASTMLTVPMVSPLLTRMKAVPSRAG